jgi:hypothetical protein
MTIGQEVSMDALFHPWPMADGIPRADLACRVVKEHPDGLATLDVGGSVVIARRGEGPGCWSALVAPLPVRTPVKVAKPKAVVPVPVVPVVPPPLAVSGSHVETCMYCLRKHRGDPLYCSDRCREAGARPGGQAIGRYGKKY